jgi:hypothetical protein
MRSSAQPDAIPARQRHRGVRYAVAGSLGLHAVLLAGLMLTRGSDTPAEPQIVELLIEESETPAFPAFPRTRSTSGHTTAASGQPTSRSPGRPKGALAPGPRAGSPTAATPPSSDGATAPGAIPSQEAPGTSGGLATFQPAHPDLRGGLKLPLEENRHRDVLAPPMARQLPSLPRELPKVLHGGAGVTADIAEDGRIRLHGPDDVSVDGVGPQATGSGAGVGLTGRFDVTDQVMKWAGQDPYAAIKSKLADETREQRLCMARRYQGERQKQELLNLSGKIRRLAARLDLAAVERRRLVFEIWDECLEESDERPDYGVMARATIVSLVREVFPEGSDLAYRPAELVVLNQRRSSRQPFAPYQRSTMKPPRIPDAGAPTQQSCGVL